MHGNQVGDAARRVVKHLVGLAERLDQAGVLIGDVEQALVRDDDERVDVLAEQFDALGGRRHAALPLALEGLRHNGDGQDVELLGDGGHHGRAAGARAAAHAGRDKDHVEVVDGLLDLLAALFERLRTRAGACARAKPFRDHAPGLDLLRRLVFGERLRVGVHRDKLHAAADALLDHVVDGVATSAANADDADLGFFVRVIVERES